MGQILVKVRDISVDDNGDPTLTQGVETVITYNAYKHTQSKYELINQVKYVLNQRGEPKLDEDGNFLYEDVPGNPNLEAQHKQRALIKNAAPVGNAGPTQKEIDQQAEIDRLKAMLANQSQASVEVDKPEPDKAPAAQVTATQKKRGPKPKQQLQESVA